MHLSQTGIVKLCLGLFCFISIYGFHLGSFMAINHRGISFLVLFLGEGAECRCRMTLTHCLVGNKQTWACVTSTW